ncbi:MAG: ATP-binding protein [Oscillospiraceae bacterium]|nr:ATP-binding protein [Oscillospiraceae bacterium]
MGIYLNPGNDLFEMAVNSEIYVDKSMMIKITNSVIKTGDRHICISRPRRFGKSMAANMLSAYYSRGCDSGDLFENLAVSKTPDFKKHLNKYNVVKFDVRKFASKSSGGKEMTDRIEKVLRRDLKKTYRNMDYDDDYSLCEIFAEIYSEERIPFVFIIDEWDTVFRVFQHDTEGQKYYLDFLRDLLKEQEYVALDYATGIFPVKKYGEHSALNMYREYTMTNQKKFAGFTGFTEEDIRLICGENTEQLEELKRWYDGYRVNEYEIYNPQSVVQAVTENSFDNYWTKTETFEALKVFIQADMDGLKQSVIKMIAGERIKVCTETFQNDMTTFKSADDVVTLLIHLGYLTYSVETGEAWIPNKEVQQEFINCIRDGGWEEVTNSIRKSDELLRATLARDEKKTADIIEEVHRQNSSVITYNNELSLSVTLALAYYSARNQYEIIREFPSGEGFADLAFIPRKGVVSPAVIAELKYDKTAEGAIEQIKNRKYTEKLQAFSGEILLVGINYNEKSKRHECRIETVVK